MKTISLLVNSNFQFSQIQASLMLTDINQWNFQPEKYDSSLRSYHTPKVRPSRWEEQPHIKGAAAARVQDGREELLHVQGQEGRLHPR